MKALIVLLVSSCFVGEAGLAHQEAYHEAWGGGSKAQEPSGPIPIAVEEGHVDSSPSGLFGSFLSHRDGRLLYFSFDEVYASKDRGRSWVLDPHLTVPPMPEETVAQEVIRLQSGKLGLMRVEKRRQAGNFTEHKLQWWISSDEGKSWMGAFSINLHGQSGLPYRGGVLLQMSNGRLVLPVRTMSAAHGGLAPERTSRGKIKDVEFEITEHALFPEMEAAFCYLSDDEGRSWYRSQGEILIWLDEGRGGIWPMDEPCVVEAPKGRLCLFGRNTLGRIFRSVSLDGGLRWSLPEPTALASSYSPCKVVSLPNRSELLCLWNQVSPDEIRGGFWRSRLSCAISKDNGESWENFQVVDLQGLGPIGRVPVAPPKMTRPLRHLENLPTDYGEVSYPSIGFFGDEVLVRYKRRVFWPKRKNSDRMIILPVHWFLE
ncbi:MAG: exo-alpha-sialidase [Planctomycetota bacterium]|nr:MAG: exo-alpha-sialidase [Planctomycetota bacterium]